MYHVMRLNPKPFEMMAEGSKTIEYRLNDEKRKKVKAGDTIIFNNNDLQIAVKVIEVINAHNFSELRTILYNAGHLKSYDEFDPVAMNDYYSKDDEHQYGVVGIRVRLIEKEDTVDYYFEKYDEQSFITIAKYILDKKINVNDDLRMCGNSTKRNVKVISLKLRRMFSKEMLDLMAYYIKYLEGIIDTAEFDTQISNVSHVNRENVKSALEFSCGLKYSISGLRSKIALKEFLENE